MPGWSSDTREYIEHRWLVRNPGHHTDVASAIVAANHARDRLSSNHRTSDITVRSEDDHLVVSFTQVKPKTALDTPAMRGTAYARRLAEDPADYGVYDEEPGDDA